MTQGTEGYQAASASRRDDDHERVNGYGDVLPSGVQERWPRLLSFRARQFPDGIR